jgi:hypothetical protein
MKNCKYTSKLRLLVEFCNEFLVVNDIDVHQLNLRPFISLQILVEIPFNKCVFLHFLNNKCIINFIFGGKTITLRKMKRFDRWALDYYFIFLSFGNV